MKNPLSNASAAAGILAFIAFLSIAACTTTDPSPQAKVPPTSPAKATEDLSFFDSIVTPEAMLPDPAERALFEMLPPETFEKGLRGYGLALIQQPGMNPNRHFCIISATWAPAGTFHQGLGGLAGPGGGFVDWVVRTPDDKYDLRVTLGTLLPVEVDMPDIDLESTAKRLLLRYSQYLNKQQR